MVDDGAVVAVMYQGLQAIVSLSEVEGCGGERRAAEAEAILTSMLADLRTLRQGS